MKTLSGLTLGLALIAACSENSQASAIVSTTMTAMAEETQPPAGGVQTAMLDKPPPTTQTPIPAPFRKTWAINKADCKSPTGATRIAIDPAVVSFNGGRFDVISLEENGPKEILMQVTLAAEGVSVKEVHVLKLDGPGSTLSYQRQGATQAYHLC